MRTSVRFRYEMQIARTQDLRFPLINTQQFFYSKFTTSERSMDVCKDENKDFSDISLNLES